MNLLIRLAGNFAEISIGASALILALLLAGRAVRKTYAAQWKYWVWLALAVRLLVPVHFEAPSPVIAIPAPQQTFTLAAPAPQSAVSVPDTVSEKDRGAYREKAESVPQQEGAGEVPLGTLLAMTWAAGAAGCLLWTVSSSVFLRRRLLRWSKAEPDGEVLRLFREECAAAGIEKGPRLMRCKKENSPMMIGLFHPALLLPHDSFSVGELRAVFRHELTHFHRRDLWYKLLLAVVCAVHWFNPLVWLMAREVNRDLELSCDEVALRGAKPAFRAEYGRAVLSVAQKGILRRSVLSTCFGSGKKELKRRLEMILDTKKKRRGAAALCIVLALTAACGAFIAYGTPSSGWKGNLAQQEPLARKLLQTRTEYIGDASAVGRVLGALPPLPDGLSQKEMFLQTSAEPYGLTVSYTARSDQTLSQADLAWAYRNAMLLLSLIQNVGRVTFQVTGPDYEMTFTYTQEQAMKLEQTDVRMLSQGESEMEKFLLELNGRGAEDFTKINGREISGLLTADEAWTALGKRLGASVQLMILREQKFGGADCYLFNQAESNQSPRENKRYALSKDGSALITIENSYPLMQNLESAGAASGSSGSKSGLSELREQIARAQETLKQAQAELEDRTKSGAADLSEQRKKVSEAEEALKKAQEEFNDRQTMLPAYTHHTDDAVESAVYQALGTFYSEPYASGNVVVSAPVIYGSFEENGGLRVFATVLSEEYELDGDALNPVSGSKMPMELRFLKGGTSWKPDGHTYAKDGSYFADSIRDFCAPHSGTAKKMLSDYGKNDPFLTQMKKNLQEYVAQSGIGAKYFHDGGQDYPIF
ncbi:M56 family metallopeptidase [Caproicibacter sp. BJN0012]|uniref:M56 family metallopeptidase n=1 Tax=Caproicibacter sp. BJN0012 TaxID=3110227 RepID=UPI002E125721